MGKHDGQGGYLMEVDGLVFPYINLSWLVVVSLICGNFSSLGE